MLTLSEELSLFPSEVDVFPEQTELVHRRIMFSSITKLFDAVKSLQEYVGTSSQTDTVRLGSSSKTVLLPGGLMQNINQIPITDDYTVQYSDFTLQVDSSAKNIKIFLPSATDHVGQVYQIKKIVTANVVTLVPFNTEKIEGSITVDLTFKWDKRVIQSNGLIWLVV